jgi:choline dehydrogenase-like flavoprotein
VIGQLRLLADHPLTETRLLTIPRWQNLTQETHPLFDRGYACLLTLLPLDRAGEEMPGCFHPQSRGPGQAGRYILACSPFGEAIPDRNNYVEIAPGGVCDAWGGSILRIHYRYSDRDQAMATDMLQTATQLIKRAGGYVIRRQEALTEPGLCIHEAGTCRMGADPATSVLNAYNQCHAAPTVFVVDGSAFPSLPAQNPTLTMMALAVRACDYAHHQIQNGTLSLSERTP